MYKTIEMSFYSTEDLLNKAYDKLSETIAVKNKKLSPPDIIRKNRKSIVTNFKDLCYSINREMNDVCDYITRELSVSASITGKGQLVFSKMLQNSNINKILSNYIECYVSCSECSSRNTTLVKQDRILFINCNNCHTKKSL